jgi:hypothetical protein
MNAAGSRRDVVNFWHDRALVQSIFLQGFEQPAFDRDSGMLWFHRHAKMVCLKVEHRANDGSVVNLIVR